MRRNPAPRSLWLCTLPLAVAAGGCETASNRAQNGASVSVEAPMVGQEWKAVANAADKDRIARLGLAWREAIAEAEERFERQIASEGELLTPRAALPRPQLTPGSYNCRMITLGKRDSKSPAFEKFKPFFCYVHTDEEGALTIVKQTGSQRPAGQLWDDELPDRMIFLGSLALGNEQEPLAYGVDPDRDMAGVLERIAPFRWRLVIPWPRSGAKLEVFELTPVANQPKT